MVVLEAWIRKQVGVLTSDESDLEDKRQIRQLFYDVATKEPAPTEDFKRRFADLIVEVFQPYLKEGEATGSLMMVWRSVISTPLLQSTL